jgi:hypothetical protein
MRKYARPVRGYRYSRISSRFRVTDTASSARIAKWRDVEAGGQLGGVGTNEIV